MSNKNLFKEAIADAKAVREAALANAKAALEEALTPKLHSMLAAKLNEMEEYEEYEEDGNMEEGMYPDDTSDEIQDRYRATGAALEEDENLEEEFDISEILAELDEETSLNEAKEEEEEVEEESNELDPEDPKFAKKLEDFIMAIIDKKMGGEEGGEMEPMDDMGGDDEESEVPLDEEEIDLEELLAELDEMGNDDGNDKKSKDKMEEVTIGGLSLNQWWDILHPAAIIASVAGGSFAAMKNSAKKAIVKDLKDSGEELPDEKTLNALATKAVGQAMDKTTGAGKGMSEAIMGIPLEQWWNMLYPAGIIASIAGGSFAAMKNSAKKAIVKDLEDNGNPIPDEKVLNDLATKAVGQAMDKTTGAGQGGMNEAIRTINTLRNELNEVNLLNAKLLYVNKIFKAKNLSESQKLKVIASFDKATTVKEAKVVFESLNSTLTASAPKQAIKESLGFASKAAGVAPRKSIVESNDVITRMQKLANIIK